MTSDAQAGRIGHDTPDSQILARNQRAIERLAHEAQAAAAQVQQIFLAEYARLAADAHIKSFLPLLVGNRVRVLLQGRRAAPA